jgi:hypothetical protein
MVARDSEGAATVAQAMCPHTLRMLILGSAEGRCYRIPEEHRECGAPALPLPCPKPASRLSSPGFDGASAADCACCAAAVGAPENAARAAAAAPAAAGLLVRLGISRAGLVKPATGDATMLLLRAVLC